MKIEYLFLLLLLPLNSFSQVIDEIKITAIEEGPIPGEVVASDLEIETEDSPALLGREGDCIDNNTGKKKVDVEDKELKLIFVGEYRQTFQMNVDGKRVWEPNLNNFSSNNPLMQNLKDKDTEELLGIAHGVSISEGHSGSRESLISNMAGVLLLGASQEYDPSLIGDVNHDNKIINWMASHVKNMELSRNEQHELYAAIAVSLYENYNGSRNVTPDGDNRPRFWAEQAFGLFNPGNRNMGSVCDDIASMVCDIATSVSPDEDCLTLHRADSGGSQHFVTLIGNKGTRDYTTIDGSHMQNAVGNGYTSDPGAGLGINYRINRVVDGKHQSIALTESQYGLWMSNVMDMEGNPGTSIVKDLDGAVLANLGNALETNVKKTITKRNGKEKDIESKFKLGANYGNLSTGDKMVAIYLYTGKTTERDTKVGIKFLTNKGLGGGYSYTTRPEVVREGPQWSRSEFNPGLGVQNFQYNVTHNNKSNVHRYHLNPHYSLGAKRSFNKGNNEFSISYMSGVYARIMGGYEHRNITSQTTKVNITDPEAPVVDEIDNRTFLDENMIVFDGNLGLSQQLNFNLDNKESGTNAGLGVRVSNELGPDDWRSVHGLAAKGQTLEALGNMTFFLNRIEANGTFTQRVSDKTTVNFNSQYLGTNIGQNWLNSIGLTLDVPSGAKVFVLTGYTAEFGGFMTNQNYLPVSQNAGVLGQAGFQKGGLRISGGVNYDPKAINTSKFRANIKAVIPITVKKKKRAPAEF